MLLTLKIDNPVLPPRKLSINLGVISDSEFCFRSHIGELCLNLRGQCGIVAKVRHFVPEGALDRYYNSNIKSLLQYGLSVYGCCSVNALSEVLIIQRKIVKIKFFQQKFLAGFKCTYWWLKPQFRFLSINLQKVSEKLIF